MKKIKKLLITLTFFLISIIGNYAYSQNYFIGYTQQQVYNSIKNLQGIDLKLATTQKDGKGNNMVIVPFWVPDGQCKIIYWFLPDNDMCFLQILTQPYTVLSYTTTYNDLKEKYVPVNTNNGDIIFKEYSAVLGTYVYKWLLINGSTNYFYQIYLTKEGYEKNREAYYKDLMAKPVEPQKY